MLFKKMMALSCVFLFLGASLGAYTDHDSECLPTPNSGCNELDMIQCQNQNPGSDCVSCSGSGNTPAVTCIVIEDGAGCEDSENEDEELSGSTVNCGGRWFGTCQLGCSNDYEDGFCSAVAGCN